MSGPAAVIIDPLTNLPVGEPGSNPLKVSVPGGVNATIDKTGLATDAKQDDQTNQLAAINTTLGDIRDNQGNQNVTITNPDPIPVQFNVAQHVIVDSHGSSTTVDDGGGSLTVDGSVSISGTPNVAVTSSVLPTGAATETTLGTRLADSTFTGRINTQGQKASAASTPVVLASDQSAIPVTDNSGSLTVDSTQLPSALVGGRLSVDGSGVTQPVSGSVTATISGTPNVAVTSSVLPTGAATSAKQPALGTAGTPSADVISVQGVSSGIAIKVDGSATTQPVSGTVTANQGTAIALSGAWPVKVTDGTNTMPTGDAVGRAVFHKLTDGTNTAVVKAGGTAASVNDAAAVVAVREYADQFFNGSFTSATLSSVNALTATGSLTISFSGTWGAANFTVEGSVNSGTSYQTYPVFDVIAGTWITTGITANGTYVLNVPAWTNVRIRCNSFTSGTANYFLRTNFNSQSLPTASAVDAIKGQASFSSNTNTTILTLSGANGYSYSTLKASYSGTFGGGLAALVQGSVDNTNWTTLNGISPTGVSYGTLTSGPSTTPLTYQVSGWPYVRINTTSYSTGTMVVDYAFSRAVQSLNISDGSNAAVIKSPGIAAGSDAALVVETRPGSGVRINDGNASNNVAVKSGTAAVSSDNAFVVTLSPNNPIAFPASTISTLANVSASVTSVTLLASNASRKSAVIVNDSTSILYVKEGSGASSTSFTYFMAGSVAGVPSTLEINPSQNFTTAAITGAWVSATGTARVTERT